MTKIVDQEGVVLSPDDGLSFRHTSILQTLFHPNDLPSGEHMGYQHAGVTDYYKDSVC
jgi:hypothetical protein